MCVRDIRSWMIRNKLKINDDKTEFLFIKSARCKINFNNSIELKIGNEIIKTSDSCKNLGVMFDSNMSMECHIKSICKAVNFHLRNIRAVRRFLPAFAVVQLVHALVTTKLDYCNSLLYGLPDYKINTIQRLQNTAARIITYCPLQNHITPFLKELHWLPVQMRIKFEILLFVYRCVNHLAPPYLCELLKPIQHDRTLRSSSQHLLHIPRTRLKTYGDRAFSVCGPREWYDLPLEIKLAPSVEVFKNRLKTFLFKQYFGE